MTPRFLPRFALALGATLAAASCESVIGADFGGAKLRPETTAHMDASAGNPDASQEASAPACNSLTPPGRRTGQTSPTDTVELTLVIRTVDYGDQQPDGGTPHFGERGYDLDGVCTDPGPSSCTSRSWLGNVAPDGPRGRDNSIGRLMLRQLIDFGVQAAGTTVNNDAVARGADAPTGILRVRNFGGLSEDERVEVDWFVPAPPVVDPDAGPTAPAFDDSDRWPIVDTTVADSTVTSASDTNSKDRDDSAYVTRNQLVAHFDHVMLPLRNTYFDAYDIVLTGDIERDPTTHVWRLERATIAGHGHTDALLGVIPEIAKRIFDATLCTDNQLNYGPVKRFICESADLGVAAGAPCTESSVGMSFTTAPASLGALVSLPPPIVVCPPETSPAKDSCSIPVIGE